MKILKSFILSLTAVCMILFLCAKDAVFENPIDPKNPNHAPDSLMGDKNNNGIADYFDKLTPPNTDKTPPVITFYGGDTVIIARNDPNYSKDSVTAHDNIDGNLIAVPSRDVYTSLCSTYTVTYTVSDKAGNKAQKTRVIIVDCDGPVITLNGQTPDSITVGRTYVDPKATAFDKVSGTANVTLPPAPNTAVEGFDTLKYSAVDKVGNKSVAIRILVVYIPLVTDTIPPVITLKGSKDTTIKLNGAWTEPGYSAWDNLDSNITNKVVVDGSVNTAAVNAYTLTYNVSDKHGNAALTQTRKITVKKSDSTLVNPPVIRLKGKSPDSVKVGTGTYTDPGCTATDDNGNDLTAQVKVTELFGKPLPISLATAAVYNLVYTVSDKAGHQTTATREVDVIGQSTDHTPPTISLLGAPKCTTGVGKRWIDPGYSAYDDVDLVITNKVVRTFKNSAAAVVDSNTFFNTIGQYSVTYTVSDNNGNQATPQKRDIYVKDTTKDTSLLARYGLPLATALPSVSNITYKTISTDGAGAPSVTTIKDFIFAWRNTGTLDNFAIDVTVSPYYLDLKGKITQTFSQAQPGFTLTGSGVSGIDGSYYIKADATQCVWGRKDGSFVIIFKP